MKYHIIHYEEEREANENHVVNIYGKRTKHNSRMFYKYNRSLRYLFVHLSLNLLKAYCYLCLQTNKCAELSLYL